MHRKIDRAQQQATPLNKTLLYQILNNCDNIIKVIRNQVRLRMGYETMSRRSKLCTLRFKEISNAADGKPIIKPNFSKAYQYSAGKVVPMSVELAQPSWNNRETS